MRNWRILSWLNMMPVMKLFRSNRGMGNLEVLMNWQIIKCTFSNDQSNNLAYKKGSNGLREI